METKKKKEKEEKRDRFYLKRYFPDIPLGWGLYGDKEIEEKAYCMPFLHASSHFQEKFQNGDESAIFKFVKKWPECFREVWPLPDGNFVPCYLNNIIRKPGGRSWVVEQIEKWKAEGTPEAGKNLKKLMSAYSDRRGKPQKPANDDWPIYRELRDRIDKGKTFDMAFGDLMNDAYNGKLNSDIQKLLKKYVEDGDADAFNTFHEIYYDLSKLDKTHLNENIIIVKNFRFQFFLPYKNVTIPEKYEKQFRQELSLYCDVEWLRKGFISFPHLREGLDIYTGVRPFEEERLPLKKALEKVSKDRNVPIHELTETYKSLKDIEALYFSSDHSNLLKEL